MARLAYDAAKSAARIAKAKQAHDTLMMEVHRSQAHALAIRARAEMRLAEEYDAAQERGEVASSSSNRGNQWTVEHRNEAPATAADLGLRRDEIHAARKLRDAERDEPGIVQRTINEMIELGDTLRALRCRSICCIGDPVQNRVHLCFDLAAGVDVPGEACWHAKQFGFHLRADHHHDSARIFGRDQVAGTLCNAKLDLAGACFTCAIGSCRTCAVLQSGLIIGDDAGDGGLEVVAASHRLLDVSTGYQLLKPSRRFPEQRSCGCHRNGVLGGMGLRQSIYLQKEAVKAAHRTSQDGRR